VNHQRINSRKGGTFSKDTTSYNSHR